MVKTPSSTQHKALKLSSNQIVTIAIPQTKTPIIRSVVSNTIVGLSTLTVTKHTLANCTLYNTGAGVYIMNLKDLLDKASFKPKEGSVVAGTTRFIITGYGTYTLKRAFKSRNREQDLVLQRVNLIKGF